MHDKETKNYNNTDDERTKQITKERKEPKKKIVHGRGNVINRGKFGSLINIDKAFGLFRH